MIRKAVVNDSPRIAEIHVFGRRCALIEFIPIDDLFIKWTVKERDEKWKEYLSGKDLYYDDYGEIYVFEENDIIKAFMGISDCGDEDKKEKALDLQVIYVDPLFQRQRIGTQLMNFYMKEAMKKSKKEVVLWVYEKNIKAINFYKKMGFIFDGKFEIDEKFNERTLRMNKDIVIK